ncbi:hypothetical protein GWK47_043669 [Chionoecetes opilio]|uniref:Peroxin/Ferlin domain-containing protein n=1 Tax=Chionoecetes opilio TaxID=41210 RepID=A0A8J5CZI2_CHIOP|nr:hypothetical protein GWK47_043669 [Chionoecetes opilio]
MPQYPATQQSDEIGTAIMAVEWRDLWGAASSTPVPSTWHPPIFYHPGWTASPAPLLVHHWFDHQYDLQRAVDGEGWEFTVESGGLVGWSPQEKIYHTRRRRRWIRERHLVEKVEKKKTVPVDGWEYAPLFPLQFHAIERKMDMVRRRRWRRRLVPSEPGLPPTPRLAITTGKGDDKLLHLTCPRMYLLSCCCWEFVGAV